MQHLTILLKLLMTQRLGKKVRRILCPSNRSQNDVLSMYLFTNKMILNVDVLSTSIKHEVIGDGYASSIILVDNRRLPLRISQFPKQLSLPYYFFDSITQ